jgi:hypothetical protein
MTSKLMKCKLYQIAIFKEINFRMYVTVYGLSLLNFSNGLEFIGLPWPFNATGRFSGDSVVGVLLADWMSPGPICG